MCAGGDDEAFVCHASGVEHVTGFLERLGILLVPHVRETLVEQQREDELLVIAGIHQSAQDGGGAPQVGFEFRQGETFSHVWRSNPRMLIH